MLRVIHIPGEALRFKVESNTLECVARALEISKAGQEAGLRPHLFNRFKMKLHVGDACPTCGGQLDLRFHLVDLGELMPVGRCMCEWFDIAPRRDLPPNHETGHNFTARGWLERMSPDDRRALTTERIRKLRCQHIDAARDFCLDVNSAAHVAMNDRSTERHGAGPNRDYHLKKP